MSLRTLSSSPQVWVEIPSSHSHQPLQQWKGIPASLPLPCSVNRLHRVVVASSAEPPSGKGFGKKTAVVKRSPSDSEAKGKRSVPEELGAKSPEGDGEEENLVPEVVTNRMLKRVGLTVGLPLAVGVLFFPLFYYLKVVKKVDVPEWLPFLVSLTTFGTAGLGITYGLVSSSWDPSREGSLLGWKEAQANWPVFLETLQGKQTKK